MTTKELNAIKVLRKKHRFPLWAIKYCLELNDYDFDKAFDELCSI